MDQEIQQNLPERPAGTVEATGQSGSPQSGSPQSGSPQPGDAHPSSSRYAVWKLWARDLVFSAVASLLIIVFLYQPVRVEGTSMLPRLENQDRLFINKFAYHFTAIKRGDVVVFHYPRNPQISYIKRVVAIPGDRLRIDHGQVFVNDQRLDEPYVPAEYRDTRSYEATVIAQGEYFVLGDHRSIASDSREFGPVQRDLIYGKAVFVYWPTEDVGVVH
jgi:signal peptidase I